MRSLTNKLKQYKLLLVIAVSSLVGFGFYFFVVSPDAPNTPEPELNAQTFEFENEPEEVKPDDTYQWQGEPNDPKYIRLSSIQTEGFMENVGVDTDRGEVAVPTNIHIAGWFNESVRPGQKGLSIIDGHVDGRREDGIFKHLAELKKDDEYTIEMGNGSILRYRVMDVVSVATEETANVLFSQDPKVESQLNLITCGGNFDPNSRLYDKRVVVTAELLD